MVKPTPDFEMTRVCGPKGSEKMARDLGRPVRMQGIAGEKGFEIAANFDAFFDNMDRLEMSAPAYTANNDTTEQQDYTKPNNVAQLAALNL